MSIKISVIGAGSSVFSLSLIKDICLTERLRGSVVSFMDINEARLDSAYSLCRRYAAELGADIRLEKTLDRRESLKGADFVINTALVVGYEKWKAGWAIAKKHGYRYGGSLHVMHDEAFWINHSQYGLMESVYLDMLDVCPGAWYLVVANPVLAGITYLKRKYPTGKIVGLCHGYGGVFGLADTLGLEREHVGYEVSGVNHMIWLTSFTYKGQNAYPLLDRWIEEKSHAYFATCHPSNGMGPKAIDLYKRFGVFPIGDTGNPGGGAWGWWYHSDSATEKRWNEDPQWWFDEIYFAGNERTIADIAAMAADPTVRVTERVPPMHTGEPMIPLIESLAFDIPRVIVTNILNDGHYVRGVPADFEVEIPSLVSARGIEGIRCLDLPKPVVSHILSDRVAPVELELAAYQSGNIEYLISMLMMDPWTRSEEQARGLVEEILAMPGLEELRGHYGK